MDLESESENKKSILKNNEILSPKKNVVISEELLIFDDNLVNRNQLNDIDKFFKNIDRSTSPIYKFSMEEFLNNIDSSIDISKINDFEITEEIINNGESKNVNCNTFYSNDIISLNNVSICQDKKIKSKEERKKEREKKKEEDLFKKYQIEQEAKHKAIARSKCGRWVKFNIKIGEGGYKFVYRGYDVTEAKNVAWCEFKRDHVDTKEKRLVMFKETEIMLKMNHSHIVRCFDVLREWQILEDQQTSIDEKGIVIIQELMGEGTLKNIIKKNFIEGQCILKFSLITLWWHQILDALRYMHQNLNPPIIHRDLKADNCFLYGQTDDEFLNVKVGDFGLATHVNTSGRKTMLGTLGFMAPEIFDEKYDESVDIYAFGMLMLEVMTNRTPYDECETMVQVAAKTLTGKGPNVLEKVGDKWLREIINSCIHPLACYRPTAEELFYHPIFQCKSLRVEVELNYDKVSDRTEVMDRFISNILNCTKVNLRLRFRDKRMLQELGLDDGESLEFDLDIYKAEDQDIPELIQNLRLEYEDKLSRVYDNPKIQDKSTISANLDKLFLSLELQMKCLVKHLLGRRWRDILDSLVAPKATKSGEGELESSDEQDEDSTNSFTMISKYKGMWTKAKRLLDKEIQNYRENSSKESNVISPTKQIDVKSNLTKVEEPIREEKEIVENDITSKIKSPLPNVMEDMANALHVSAERESMENVQFFKDNLNRGQFQIPPLNTITMEVTEGHRDASVIDPLNIVSKPTEAIDSEAPVKEILTIKPISYNIRIQNLDNYISSVNVTFVVEIPDLSKPDGGKWILSFRCVITEYSNLDSFELNASGIFIDKVDYEVNVVLQETVQCILKLIQLNKNCILIDQNYVFFPKEENLIISDIYPSVISRIGLPNFGLNPEYYREGYLTATESIRSNAVDTANNLENISRTNTDNSTSNEVVNEKIKNYVESLFENDNVIILIKRMENDDKEIIKAHYIPLGTAIVINNDMTVQLIKKTTIISPRTEVHGSVFVRELDKSDLSMDKAINILSLLQEKIADLSSKESNKDLIVDINTKVLYETKLKPVELSKSQSSVDSNAENFIDKQKIIEQVLKQKKEIEKLQWQQSQFLALLENNAKLLPTSDQDILNQQKINNKLYLNQMNSPSFNNDSGYPSSSLYHQPVMNTNQVMFSNNDPRLLMSNNSLKNCAFVNPEGMDYQNPSNIIMDNSIRPQMHYLKGSINDNITTNIHHADNNIRFNASVKETVVNVGDMNRMFCEQGNQLGYQPPIERMDMFDNSSQLHQLHFHGHDQQSEEMLTKMNYSSPLLPTYSDHKADTALNLQQYYKHNPPLYYKFPYQALYLQQHMPPQNYFDHSKMMLGQAFQPSLQHCMDHDITAIKKENIIDHVLTEDINLKNESQTVEQIRADPISFSNFITNDTIHSVYRDAFIGQKLSEKSEACINVQKHSIEDITKETFNNR